MKIEIESLRQPRVEVSTNIIGILQAMDAREDWNSLVLGGLANVVIARLNIDIQIQIKTLVITPDSNQTTFTFSTQKNYIGTGQKFLGRFFADAAYNLKNNLGYNEGQWNYAVETADDASSKLNSGFNVGNANPLKTNTVLIDANGISTNGSTINPQDDSIVNTNDEIGRMLYFHFVKINAGRIEVYTEDNTGERVNEIKIQPNGLFQTSDRAIVSLDQEGFTIRTNVAGVLEKQFYVDTDGNIVFAGRLTQALSNALKGEPGTNGINGINGTNGINGGSGPKGDDGDEGDVGPGVVYQGQ